MNKKAYDTVDHNVLLAKLSLCGIQDSVYDWFKQAFKSYLNNCTKKCVVNGSLSKVFYLGCRVPQGTILGPLLFLIYINDLPNCLSFCQPWVYADDTHVTHVSADLPSMQSNLKTYSYFATAGTVCKMFLFSFPFFKFVCLSPASTGLSNSRVAAIVKL